MKSKTSFFNFYVLKKDITRFLPVWGLYTVFLIMSRVLVFPSGNGTAWAASVVIHDLMPAMAVINLIYAAICAVTLFGDLYTAKMCNALHAMPLRREGWFLTHTAAALLFSLLPNLLAILTLLPALKSYWYTAFILLGSSSLQYVFFLGLAVFSAFCAGSRLGMIAIYGILNALSLLIYGMADTFFMPLLYGAALPFEPFLWFCPVATMTNNPYFLTEFLGNSSYTGLQNQESQIFTLVKYLPESWNSLYILAAVGVVLAFFAVLLYRKRQLERAGDLLALRPLVPLFLLVITLTAGTLFYLFADLFFNRGTYVFLFAGMLVGYLVCQMLLKRTVKVFTVKGILGYALIALVLAGSLFVTKLDPAGITTRIPQAEDVKSVTLTTPYNQDAIKLEEQKEIETVLRFHSAFLDDPSHGTGDNFRITHGEKILITLSYSLKDSSSLTRRYQVSTDLKIVPELTAFLSNPAFVLGAEDPETLARTIESVDFSLYEADLWGVTLAEEGILPLLEAVRKDCEEGHMAQGMPFHASSQDEEAANINLLFREISPDGGDMGISFQIYESCRHTMALLRQAAKDISSQ